MSRGVTKRRLKTAVGRFFHRPWVDATVMVLIIASVALLVLEWYDLVEGRTLEMVVVTGHVITGVFIVELSLRWFAAPGTRAHFREFWLDWLAVIPFLRPLRVLRLLRLYRFGVLAHRFTQTFDFRRYEDRLRETVAHYTGPHDEHIWLTPDLFRALTNLLDDGRVHREARARICQGLAYFITPFDLLPEETHGAEGYIDQVYVCLRVLDDLREELPEHVLEEAWEGEGDLAGLIEEVLAEVEEAIGAEGVEQVERYVGVGKGIAVG